MDIVGCFGISKNIFKIGRYFYAKYRDEPRFYLSGELKTGQDIAYRIIALFEAHGVKRTQIYHLLGDQFPEITPSLDVVTLKSLLNGKIIDAVGNLFGVRKAWLEGEAGKIYEPLCHYKDLPAFLNFVAELKKRNSENCCFLTALKPVGEPDDLYSGCSEIALFFSEQIAEINGIAICRYSPIYGAFEWGHKPSRYHLSAFFNVADRAQGLIVTGVVISMGQLSKISNGMAIPHNRMKTTGVWHPEDYGYPIGHTIGKLKAEDWSEMLDYLHGSEILNADYSKGWDAVKQIPEL